MADPDTAPVALVTGAARRIGAQIASTLHEAGYNVVLHYHRSRDDAGDLADALNHQRPDSVVLMSGNLRDVNALRLLGERAIAAWGRLDLLVNNASTFYPTPVGQITEKHWDDLVGTNLKAPLFLSQAVAGALADRGGSIVNLVDIHAERPLEEHPVYCAAKAGLAMLTRSLALELAPRVRVNGIAPGAILWPEEGMDGATQESLLDGIPLGRRGEPGDIADGVLMLTQSPYITGQVLAVDGGRSLSS